MYIHKVSYIHSFFVIFSHVFSTFHAEHFEIWKNILWNWWVNCFTAWFIKWSIIFQGVHRESFFPFMDFFSRNNCFLWSPCLLLIAESISLDSGKPCVSFFLKITSPSWIILSMSLDELEEMMMNFLEIIFILLLSKNFDMEKIIGVFWRPSLNIIFWILLWMLTSLVI